MTATLLIYDRHGQLLDAVPGVAFGTRTWLLNDAGDCVLTIPRTHPKCTRANFGRLNLIVIKSDLGVPDWGGRIDSATWNSPAAVTVTCKSKEKLLDRCVVDAVQKYSNWTPGQIVAEVVQKWGIDTPQHRKIMRLGSVFVGGDPIGGELDFTGADVWGKVIPDLRDLSGHDYWVDADGTFQWAEKRGRDLSSMVVLRSGRHITRAVYVEDYGSFITRAVVWGKSNASHEIYQDPAAVGEWDMLTKSIVAPDDSLLSLAALATVAVDNSGEPEQKLDLRLINRDGLFGQFWIGDTVRVILPKLGWAEEGGVDMYLRVGGIEVDERNGTMRVIGAVDPDVTARKKVSSPVSSGSSAIEETPLGLDPYDSGEFPDGDLWNYGDDGFEVSDDGGDTWDNVEPDTGPTEDACDPGGPPNLSLMTKTGHLVDRLGILYETWVYHVPGGNWRSWLATSSDKGATWTWSDTIQPAGVGGDTTELENAIGSGVALWSTENNASTYAGINGAEVRLSDNGVGSNPHAWDPSPTALAATTNVTIWGTVNRETASDHGMGSPPGECLEQIQVNLIGQYDSHYLTWESGESGFKSLAFDIDPQNVHLEVWGASPGYNRPFFDTGELMAEVIRPGAIFTADIPPATNPCDGTQLGSLAGDADAGGAAYALGHSDVSHSIGVSVFDPDTGTFGDWHVILPNVTAEEYAAGTKALQIKTPASDVDGDVAYAFGTDGSNAVVYKSTDRGETWTAVGAGLPAGVSVQALAVRGDGPGLTSNYAFTSDGKVYRQSNGAGAWDGGTAIAITPTQIRVSSDANRTIRATDGIKTMTAPEPYVSWTLVEA